MPDSSPFSMLLTGSSVLIGGLLFLGFLLFAFISIVEREPRATRVALGLTLVAPLPFFLVGLASFPGQPVAAGVLVGLSVVAILLLVLPSGQLQAEDDAPQNRVDERDIMFARAALVPGSPEFESYYALCPENKPKDDRFRAAPGLLNTGSQKHHPLIFPAAIVSFDVIKQLHGMVEGEPADEQVSADPACLTRFIKNLTKYYGATQVGITKLKDCHIYTHVGRGSGVYGAPVELDHKYAIAFTVKMDPQMIRTGPEAPEVLEVTKQYRSAAVIGVELAAFIRSIGYPARAHIDGDYRVICPLVARDAGLGEIGRMGLLMTPKEGPMVRIAVVSTDLPVLTDRRVQDTSMIEFCRVCKKCAENCPSRSISFEDRIEIGGVKRWQINADTCYLYWSMVGTDCGCCLATCPYSHPDNFLHGMVRWATKRSAAARWLSLQMDDLFYGRRPEPAEFPDWVSET